MQVQRQYTLKRNIMKIEFFNSIKSFFFLRLPDIKIAWINPCDYTSLKTVQILLYLQTKIGIIKNQQI